MENWTSWMKSKKVSPSVQHWDVCLPQALSAVLLYGPSNPVEALAHANAICDWNSSSSLVKDCVRYLVRFEYSNLNIQFKFIIM